MGNPSNVTRRALSSMVKPESKIHKVSRPLIDTFNRKHTYLRISLTDRCNLRCNYCMPPTAISEFSPSSSILTTPEILRLATLFVRQGVNKIRLTGGEPTIRKDIIPLVKELSSNLTPLGLKTLAMTSNGVVLRRKLPELVESGLTHLNLSLDTLDPSTFVQISNRPSTMHAAALSTLQLALSLTPPLKSLKLNVVAMADMNLHELPAFAALTRDHPITVRFIEYMPFSGTSWRSNQMVPSRTILERLKESFSDITQVPSDHISTEATTSEHSTAKEYRIPGYKGSIGFISSMSDHFCASCTRLRITADGQLKVCLFDPREVSLRDMMRGGASDETLLEVISAAVDRKKASHGGMDLLNQNKDANRSMIRIGLRAKRQSINSNFLLYNPMLQVAPGTVRWKSTTTSESSLREREQNQLSHIDTEGRPHMVDVTSKEITSRSATATGTIHLNELAYSLLTTPPSPQIQPVSQGPDDESSGDSVLTMEEIRLSKARHKIGTTSNVLTVAQLAGIMAAKSTSTLIPLCHPLPLTNVSVQLRAIEAPKSVECIATVRCDGKTGVEMEALTAVSLALLTVWDMLKKVGGESMLIGDIKVVEKKGGKSGDFRREQ